MSTPYAPSRRDILRWGAAAGAAGLATPLLAACASSSTSTSGNAATASLPDYVPLKTVPAWLPALPNGVEAGYNSFPTHPLTTVKQAPLKGGSISGFCLLYVPPPTPMASNAEWKEVNRRMGGTFNVDYVAASDYLTKATTMMAGNDFPDLFQITGLLPNEFEFLQAKCVDLTPRLAGSAIRKYPNLANLPTFTWKASVLNGSIYGVPVPRALMGNPLYVHQEMFDELGVTEMKNADDVLRVLKELTRPSENRWAITAVQGTAYRYLLAEYLFHVPNNWRVDKSGHFTHAYETEEHKEAVAYWTKAVQAGVVVPGSNAYTNNQMKDAFSSGKAACTMDGWGATFDNYWASMTAINPNAKLRLMALPGHDGGKQTFYLASGIFGYTAIPKSSANRVDELLGALNFLAAPFGTSEYLLLNYGVEGVDYHVGAGGNPIPTQQGEADITIPWGYLGAGPEVRYNATTPDSTRYAYEGEKALIPLGISDPTVGLYSETYVDKSAVLTTNFLDGISDIMAGRRQMSDYGQLVSEWRSAGGNQMRTEYQKAYEEGQKKKSKS